MSQVPDKDVIWIRSLIDKLPLEMKGDLIKVIVSSKYLTYSSADIAGLYDYTNRLIWLRDGIASDSTFYHEMMHSLIRLKVDSGDYDFLLDFLKVTGAKDSKQYRIAAEARDKGLNWTDWYTAEYDKFPYAERPDEQLAAAFGSYGSGNASPEIKAFIKSHMPIRLEHPVLTDAEKLSQLELAEVVLKRTQNLTRTRELEQVITDDCISRKPKFKSDEDAKAWWRQFYAARDVPWEERRATDLQLYERQNLLSRRLSTELTPEVPMPPVIENKLTPAHIAYIFSITGDDLTRSVFRADALTVMPEDYFVTYVKSQADIIATKVGKTAEDIGFTDDAIRSVYKDILYAAGFDPSWVKSNQMVKATMQLEEVRKELHRIKATKAIPDSDYQIIKQYQAEVNGNLEKLPMYQKTPAIQEGAMSWLDKRNTAMLKARKDVELRFTDYSNDNAIDAAMQKIFPYWAYESQRYFWLPRTFLRTPGVLGSIGKYMNYTDEGYIPIPGTDLQGNILRGTAFMGGFRRMFRKDYPEYYDAFPGTEFLDYIGRLGFYPGVNFMLPQVVWGAAANRKPEWTELLPAWAKSGFDAVLATMPSSDAVIALTQQIFPDRFRDYLTMQTLSAQNIDGQAIYDKIKDNIALSETEKSQWARAVKKATGVKGILMEQSAVLRLRPPEYVAFLNNSRKAIEEMTGVDVETQKKISRYSSATGKRLSDYVHVDILQQKFLTEIEGYENWRSVTSSMQPSLWQEEDRRTRNYYRDVEALYDSARTKGLFNAEGIQTTESIQQITSDWVNGRISAAQWYDRRSAVFNALASSVDQLGRSAAYADVAKTLEQREQRLVAGGVPRISS